MPIDSVIAVNAEARGVEIVYGDAEQARELLGSERFDCILVSNVLHLVGRPGGIFAVAWPSATRRRASSQACRICPDATSFKTVPFRENGQSEDYESSGMHATTGRLLRRWLRKAGLRQDNSFTILIRDEAKRSADELSLGLAQPVLGSNVYLSGS